MISISDYEEIVSQFELIHSQLADELIQQSKGLTIILITRKTCPFCRKFAPKLKEATNHLRQKVYYVDSEKTDQDIHLADFRQQYNVQTVPSLIVTNDTASWKIVSDSSLSIEEIISFISGEHADES